MRIAFLSPLPPEQTGIAEYAACFKRALETERIDVSTPLPMLGHDPDTIRQRVWATNWDGIQLVHAELGGGRLGEFHALRELRRRFPSLPLTATVHDPERLVWRRSRLPWPLSLAERLPNPLPQAATLMADPLTLSEERRLAHDLTCLITLTQMGADCLSARMRVAPEKIAVIAHGTQNIPESPLPDLSTLRLLYFGFIYRGKGIEDLLDALALCFKNHPALKGQLRLTLSGGSEPETTFNTSGRYLGELRATIDRLGLAGNIDWRLDLPAEDIPALIQEHHVMVLPYRESKKLGLLGVMRGTSGALSWACACGRGVITSNARAFAEEVANGNGITYPQGNTKELSNRIIDLAGNKELIRQWSVQAHKKAEERLWPHTAKRFHQLFVKACQKN